LQSPVAIFPEITALPEGTQVLSVSRTANELIVIDQNRKIYLLSLDGEKLLHMQALP
jgi:spore germination protein GerM